MRLRIGLPSKGRLAELTAQLLRQAGVNFRRLERALFARAREFPVDMTFLRAEDIPVLCTEGAIDLGITGSDLVAEASVPVTERLRLGIGNCCLALCVPEESRWKNSAELDGKRIATTFPRLTSAALEARNIAAHFVPLSGSVEIMIQLGVADAIVDLVETGSTLAAHGLRVLEEIGRHETVLIQSPLGREPALTDRLVRRLEGVVIANAYSLLEYNIPRDRLADAERVTPGYKSPTISALEDPQWCAVKVMVQKSLLLEAMERLEQIGAVAILETEINNCRL